jgi:hypothetical protein
VGTVIAPGLTLRLRPKLLEEVAGRHVRIELAYEAFDLGGAVAGDALSHPLGQTAEELVLLIFRTDGQLGLWG